MEDTDLRTAEWKTQVYGGPYHQYFSRVSEYFSPKGTILLQFWMDEERLYHVKFTATKEKRLLPRITVVPTMDYDKAYRIATQGMKELERIINDDTTRHDRTD